MAKNSNPGKVDIDRATDSIVNNGGGVSSSWNRDGSIHTSVYSKSEDRHLSYDEKDGKVSNVHTDKDGRAYMDYGNGK
ncbi:hypothetical protein IJK16_02030 [Candidatus Saccharibacteria bacterium]|nr:hypothetical protein [Candidatus Saccharibacteria bacterium]